MNKTFTIEDVRIVIHKELANFVSLACLANNQEKNKQVLIRYGSEVLLKLMTEFERYEQT